jgi:DNA mismatch repair protein MutH
MPKADKTIDVRTIHDIPALVRRAKWLEGKTLAQVSGAIRSSDRSSRVTTKGNVGHLIEKGFFGIEMNSSSEPDIPHLGVEIKTCPLAYNKERTRLHVKEPLSLNIINYIDEAACKDITESALYRKNRKVLFVLYIHDDRKRRSEYVIKYVFLWEMDGKVLDELRPDYRKIIAMIREGRAHEIHQGQHAYLTLCPKHGGVFRDPNDRKSKTEQPFSKKPAEVRAFRLKNSYMNMIISRHLGKTLEKGGWKP